MKKFHMFEIYANEEGVYFVSTDEEAQNKARKLFEDVSNESIPDFKIPSWPKSTKVLNFLQKLKLELGMDGWEPFAVTQKGTDINFFFRKEVTD